MKQRAGLSLNTHRLVCSIVRALGCSETAHGAALLSGRFRDYVAAEINPSEATRDEYLVSEVLSKFPFDFGIDRAKVAFEKFVAVETELGRSDLYLRSFFRRGFDHPDVFWIFHSAKRKIESCLGPFDWSKAEQFVGFGPGANVGVKRRVSQVPNKYGNFKPSVTQSCLDLAVAAICSHSVWRDFHTSINGSDPEQWFSIVPGNKIVTVPKNSKTDRMIAIEPQMNMYIQKGIGGLIRQRLLRVGVNLNDQSVNQALAREGCIGRELGTIDLSSASDSVSLFLVREMLPPDWVAAIELCRSPRGVLPDGSSIYYRKVSSMGNGYTFELESLLFWAFCRSTIEYLELLDQRMSVYGDDIICPCPAVPLLLEVLRIAGFTPNAKKTFFEGGFRESCGYHGSRGVDVTPFYIRENVDSLPSAVLFANLLRQWASKDVPGGWGADERLKGSWELCVNLLPDRYRVYGPLWLGNQLNDLSIGANFDEVRPSRAPHQLEGFSFKRLARRHRPLRFDHVGTLIGNLDVRRGISTKTYSSTSVEGGWSLKRSVTPQWRDVGPWVNTQG